MVDRDPRNVRRYTLHTDVNLENLELGSQHAIVTDQSSADIT